MSTAAVTPKPLPKRPPKPRFAIHISVVTDGALPESSNLLAIQAFHSENLQWRRNILPQHPLRQTERVPQEVRTQITVGAIPLSQAIQEFGVWLEKFKGSRVAVTSAVAFWHLQYHFQRILGKSPLLMHPIDVSSYLAGAATNLLNKAPLISKDPLVSLQERMKLISTAEKSARASRW